MAIKYDVLASEQNVKHTIKGGVDGIDQILDGAQLTTLLKAYYIKYGQARFIQQFISTFADIKGGIAFNNSKEQLIHLLNARG